MPGRGAETARIAGSGRLLIYSFAFPHYRAPILEKLQALLGARLDLVSGRQSRAGLRALSAEDLAGLEVLPGLRLGPVSWEHGVVRRASSHRYAVVVLGPAVTSLSTWTILVLRRLRGRPTMLWGQCGKPGDRSLKRMLQEIMNRLSSGMLVYGDLEARGATELGSRPHKVHRVRNAVPLEPVQYAPGELRRRLLETAARARDEGVLRLLYIGRMNPDKQVEVLLRAAELLVHEFPRLSVRLIGDGPDLARLRTMFPDPRYRFSGASYDPAALQREILDATFVVSPATLGLLALDALSAGVPVMVPDNPKNGSEVDALTPGVNAFTFAHGSASDLARAISSAVGRLPSASLAAEQRREQGIAEWSPERVARNICAAIEALGVPAGRGAGRSA